MMLIDWPSHFPDVLVNLTLPKSVKNLGGDPSGHSHCLMRTMPKRYLMLSVVTNTSTNRIY